MAYVRDRIGTEYTLLRPDALAYPMLAKASVQSYTEAYWWGATRAHQAQG
jgi:hypothetical protein